MLVVTEKGSVAAAIRRALTPPPRTFALRGHLLNLDFPDEYNKWWRVDPKELFKAPVRWVIRDNRAYRGLIEALNGLDGPLILATDNDHEGELIAYEVLQIAKKVLGWVQYRRMRFNTTSPGELRRAWLELEPDLNWGWVWKAYFRSKFDLVTGATYTRLLTLSARRSGYQYKLLSWGSCQTPTLWFIYRREMEIRGFKPKTYYVLRALLDVKGVKVYVSSKPILDGDRASSLYKAVKGVKHAIITEFKSEDRRQRRPLPTDTDTMLQELTKILKLTGAKIMSLAEQLYANGYISYPRTQTNVWVRVPHKAVLNTLMDTGLRGYVESGVFNPLSGRKNDGAHPPIYPVKPYPYKDVKAKIWEYIARRYLANVASTDALLNRWRLTVDLSGVDMEATGRYVLNDGFYRVFPYFKPKELKQIPEVKPGELLPVIKVELLKRKTKPPSRLTESELLRLMEQHGIGTDATRHEYPAKIVSRGYVEREGRSFRLTELGERLVNLLRNVDGQLVTPETRRLVEQLMGKVEREEVSLDEALNHALKIYRELYEKLERRIKSSKLEL